jgi:hypothetical protein
MMIACPAALVGSVTLAKVDTPSWYDTHTHNGDYACSLDQNLDAAYPTHAQYQCPYRLCYQRSYM